ncbi:hypothetical protein [Allorhodopirellula heiligendammensis]|uniref:Uncharacterized protein n=1 Tax=Allorhodopirellula heiligendammensis TaxID=2714739 RepID=A0A5C6C1L5_9BACT|nr:hypothetical protein [Allorhodopirellula heiligendammensis]TWU16749.1 hypothetical protein Poly21_39550 [Allorhodopirellula heiligendammensis]
MTTRDREIEVIDVNNAVLPKGIHREYTIRGAEAGQRRVVRKPIAITGDDCR